MDVTNNSAQNLSNFVKQCKDRLKKILERLDWSEDKVKKNFNSNSIASKPIKKSKIVQPPKKPEYPDSYSNQNSLVLGTTQLRELLQNNEVLPPQNFQELQANFTREQKLKIYQHVIENTKNLEYNLETQGPEDGLTLADIVEQKKREEKRKKRKFRKSKPTHIEEVRCLVELQMQALKQFMDKSSEINDSRKKSSKKEEYNDNDNHKRYKTKSRVPEKGNSSCSHSKELTKAYGRNTESCSKDLTNTNRKKLSRSPGGDSLNAHKSRRRSCERRRYDRSYSRELNYKHKRRSRSSSYDRHSRYLQHSQFAPYRYKSSSSKSPHFDAHRSRHSKTKSSYKKERRRNSPKEPKRKRRSKSRETSHKKDYKEEDDYYKKSSKRKHTKEKKKKDKRS